MTWKKTSHNDQGGRASASRLRKAILLVGVPALILALAYFSGTRLFRLYQASAQKEAEPAEIIEVNEPFSGTAHFNDKLGTDDFSNLFVSSIDKASSTIEIAVYSMDSQDIKDALYRAADRGVAVRLIFSDKRQDILQQLFDSYPANMEMSFIGSPAGGYMHHKFMIIDRGQSGQKLFFSSYNFTYIQGRYDPSFILETGRPEIIRVFGEEFDRLSDKTGKRDDFAPFAARIIYPEGFLEIWFSPGTTGNSIKDRMISLIKSSTSGIKAMIWSMTDSDMAAELAEAAKREPVSVITDDFNEAKGDSIFPALKAQKGRQGLDNLTIINDAKRNAEVGEFLPNSGLNSYLHQHLLITDDRIAAFGTENWSGGGFFRNSESVMVTDIPAIVQAFLGSFEANRAANE